MAEQVGTSRMTVSNVLNGRDARVSPPVREKVWRAVKELGYIPVAGPIAQKRRTLTRTIGVVYETFDAVDHGIGTDFFAGMVETARKLDFDLLTVLRAPRQWEGAVNGISLLDGRADAFVFLNSLKHGNEETLTALVSHGVPAVVAFRRDVPEGIATVDCDNEGAIELAVKHLVGLGHKRIMHISGDPQRSTAEYRVKGYVQTMSGLGLFLGEDWIVGGSFSPRAVNPVQLAQRVIDLKATAVVCASDFMGLMLWDALTALGKRVPEDISLVGVDNVWQAEARGLTTAAIPGIAMGELSITLCEQLVQGSRSTPLNHVLPVRLVERISTSPPNSE